MAVLIWNVDGATCRRAKKGEAVEVSDALRKRLVAEFGADAFIDASVKVAAAAKRSRKKAPTPGEDGATKAEG